MLRGESSQKLGKHWFRACLTSLCVTSGISGCGAGKWLSLWSFDVYNSVYNYSIRSRIWSWPVIGWPDLLRTQLIFFSPVGSCCLAFFMLVLSCIRSVIFLIWNCLQSSRIFFQTVLQTSLYSMWLKFPSCFISLLFVKSFVSFHFLWRPAKDVAVSSIMSTMLLVWLSMSFSSVRRWNL